MKWFNNPQNLEELKKQYRDLAMQNHPDRGGSVEAMQEINSEYDKLFSRLKNIHAKASDKKTDGSAKHETQETPEEFRNIIEKLIHMEGITIEICGSWIWVSGNTFQHKENLKSAGFKWASKKSMWYWYSGEYHRSGKTMTMEKIREKYGSQKIETEVVLRLA